MSEEIENVFNKLTQENQDIMLLLAKGMEISQNANQEPIQKSL